MMPCLRRWDLPAKALRGRGEWLDFFVLRGLGVVMLDTGLRRANVSTQRRLSRRCGGVHRFAGEIGASGAMSLAMQAKYVGQLSAVVRHTNMIALDMRQVVYKAARDLR